MSTSLESRIFRAVSSQHKFVKATQAGIRQSLATIVHSSIFLFRQHLTTPNLPNSVMGAHSIESVVDHVAFGWIARTSQSYGRKFEVALMVANVR